MRKLALLVYLLAAGAAADPLEDQVFSDEYQDLYFRGGRCRVQGNYCYPTLHETAYVIEGDTLKLTSSGRQYRIIERDGHPALQHGTHVLEMRPQMEQHIDEIFRLQLP